MAIDENCNSLLSTCVKTPINELHVLHIHMLLYTYENIIVELSRHRLIMSKKSLTADEVEFKIILNLSFYRLVIAQRY